MCNVRYGRIRTLGIFPFAHGSCHLSCGTHECHVPGRLFDCTAIVIVVDTEPSTPIYYRGRLYKAHGAFVVVFIFASHGFLQRILTESHLTPKPDNKNGGQYECVCSLLRGQDVVHARSLALLECFFHFDIGERHDVCQHLMVKDVFQHLMVQAVVIDSSS